MLNYEKMDEIARNIERAVNVLGSDSDSNMNYLAIKTVNFHRTLNQSFTSKFILQFVKHMAENYESGYYDARNEVACKICNEMWNLIKSNHGDEINLPLV